MSRLDGVRSRLPRLEKREKLVGAIVLLSALTALAIWFTFTVFSPTDPEGEGRVITIESGSGVGDVASRLRQEGIIRSPIVFTTYFFLTGSAGDIKAGKYLLSPALSYDELRRILTGGRVTEQRVTLIEGWRVSQMAEKLAQQGVVTEEAFLEAAVVGNFTDFSFLAGLPPEQSLEGYLFPDTYQLATGADPVRVIEIMLRNFDRRVGSLSAEIERNELSLHQVVNVASIVEREARTLEDQKLVADILIKRYRAGMPLQADATSLYEIGDWRHRLTQADLAQDSPYNTRRHPGLPPTPIANPGLDSIRAVLNPTPSPYLYYLTGRDGRMYYAETLEEHNRNIERHLR